MAAAWLRLELRRRWRSLLVLALLVALAAGTVMTAVAGARRGASGMDRLQAATQPATVLVVPNIPGFDWAPVRALPGVEALGRLAFTGYEIDGRPGGESFMVPPADAQTMHALERPVVLAGRLADAGRADEVVVTPAFLRTYGRSVGDTVRLGLYTPEQVDTGQVPGAARTNLVSGVWLLTYQQQAAAVAAGLQPDPGAPADGPVVEATIVGVVRSPMFGDQLDAPGFLVPSAGLVAAHPESFFGAEGVASTGALVRLSGGAAAIPAFRAALAEATGRPDLTVHDLTAPAAAIGETLRFEATALYVLAGVAAVAGVFLIGGSAGRQVASMLGSLRVLSAVGMTPRQVAGAAATGPAVAAAAGTVLGAAVAVVVSRWFPVGSASFHEPAPGVSVDPAVLVPGVLLPPLLVAVTAAVLARAGLADRPARRRTSAVTRLVAGARLPVPVVLGTRFALERGAAGARSPVRPALAGAVVGVTGVLAALTFSDAARDAAQTPFRFGVVHQAEAWVGFDRGRLASAEDVFPALADVPGVRGVDDVRGQLGDAGDAQVMVVSFHPVGEPLNYLVTAGRMPSGRGEALVSLAASGDLGVGVGDVLPMAGSGGAAELAVVGVAVLDPGFGTAVVVAPSTYDALFDGAFLFQYAAIGLDPAADPAAVLPALAAAVPDQTYGIRPFEFSSPPELRLMRSVPVVLGGCVALLAAGAVGHGLVTAVRQRRRELAVLRAVGMTPAQSTVAVTAQSLVLALAGLAFGVPLGLALGRTVWRSVATTMRAHYVAPGGWQLVAVVALLTVLAAVLLAAWPARRAASLRVGSVLRAE
ncbi:ABC transporter permease [Jiangella alba]|uniref:FtsX-like permease family protein n=1 Tax=Jiangella alba TaxID=561176 RepID=A0A1H5P4D9_9ACTN|nr:FtsX-like permease family protein [Jiangella alba]SEF08716.1 FtsX-like permease family protein [Jiangella alba]